VSTRFRLITLGALAVEADGERFAPLASQRKALALLAFLAAHGRRGVSRDRIVIQLWPSADNDSARNALAQLLHRVRRELGSECIEGNGELILNDSVMSNDVVEFRTALAEGSLRVAVDLYRGAFLDGVQLRVGPDFERWVDGERNTLHAAYEKALDQLGAEAERSGDRAGAVEWYKRRVDIDPLSSAVTLRYMDALTAAGNREGAIRHAQVYAALMKSELDAEPDAKVIARADALRSPAVSSITPASARVNSVASSSGATAPETSATDAVFGDEVWQREPAARSSLRWISRRGRVVTVGLVLLAGVYAFSRSTVLRTTGLFARSAASSPKRSADVRIRRVANSAFVGGGAGDVSHDGRFFYAQSGAGQRQLTRITLATGAIDTIAQFDGAIDNVRASLDGRLLAVSVWVDVLPTERATYGGVSMWVVGTDGSEKHQLARPQYIQDFEAVGWMPDSRHIVVTAQRDSGTGVSHTEATYAGLLSVADGRLEKVAEMGPGWPFWTRISPDGRYLAYTIRDQTNGHTRARVFSIATGLSSDIMDWPENHEFVEWTADSRGAYVERQRGTSRELWLQPLENGRPAGASVLLKSELPDMDPAGVSGDGRLHYVVGGGNPEVITVTIDSTTQVAAAAAPVHVHAAHGTFGGVYSPNGKYVAYVARYGPDDIAGAASLVLESLDGMEQREIPLSTSNSFVVNWFPGTSRVLIRGNGPRAEEEGHIFDAASGKEVGTSMYAEPVWIALGRPAILADGSVLRGVRDSSAAGRWQEADNKVVLYDASSKTDRVLGRVSRMVRMVPSPDGKSFVALVQDRNESSLQLYRIDGGRIAFVRRLAPLLIPGPARDASSTLWGRDGQSILMAIDMTVPDGPERTTVVRYPLSGAPAEHLFDVPAHVILNSVHPNGRRFAFLRTARLGTELWALEQK
jgi:DNA-binding SARP family transcriptional activator/Tol biopolymer transport system component